jgi:hypothetical protein
VGEPTLRPPAGIGGFDREAAPSIRAVRRGVAWAQLEMPRLADSPRMATPTARAVRARSAGEDGDANPNANLLEGRLLTLQTNHGLWARAK